MMATVFMVVAFIAIAIAIAIAVALLYPVLKAH